MLRDLLRLQEPFYIVRHEEAPLLQEREAFLKYLLEQGTSVAALRGVAWQLLNVIRLMKLTRLREVQLDEIEKAAQRWARQQRTNPLAHSYGSSATFFVYVAKKWLRFAGVLKKPTVPRLWFADEVEEFLQVFPGFAFGVLVIRP